MLKCLLVLMAASLVFSSCSDARVASVTAPTMVGTASPPPVSPPSVATYTLFGVISEAGTNGRIPIEGVIVEEMTCDALNPGCGINRIVATKTDANGYYSLPGLNVGKNNFLWLTKPGFRIDVQIAPGCDFCYRSLTIDTDTRLDIELSREGRQ